jgi:hypothetical protein
VPRPLLLTAALVGLALGGYSGASWLLRPSSVAAGSPQSPEIMYLCRETKALSRGPRQQTPAVNPTTGRATLVQALYCPQCRKWRAAPPPAMRERQGTGPMCPVHRAPLYETKPGAADSVAPPIR